MKIDRLARDIVIASASFILTCWILHWATLGCAQSTTMMAVMTAFVILVTIIIVIGNLYDKGFYNE